MDDAGVLRPAAVVPGASLADGAAPGCGWSIGSTPTAVPLTAPVPAGEWTAELRYVADRDGAVAVALGAAPPVLAPVRAGSGTVYLRLPGEGQVLQMTAPEPGPALCVGGGVVGDVVVR
jgi:hypothetical protein